MVKNLPANIGDTGSNHGPGRSHKPGGNWACVPQPLKPGRLEPVLRNKRSHSNEKPVHGQLESSPHSQQLEEAYAQQGAQQGRPEAAENK